MSLAMAYRRAAAWFALDRERGYAEIREGVGVVSHADNTVLAHVGLLRIVMRVDC
jgi:hypothetical protein